MKRATLSLMAVGVMAVGVMALAGCDAAGGEQWAQQCDNLVEKAVACGVDFTATDGNACAAETMADYDNMMSNGCDYLLSGGGRQAQAQAQGCGTLYKAVTLGNYKYYCYVKNGWGGKCVPNPKLTTAAKAACNSSSFKGSGGYVPSTSAGGWGTCHATKAGYNYNATCMNPTVCKNKGYHPVSTGECGSGVDLCCLHPSSGVVAKNPFGSQGIGSYCSVNGKGGTCQKSCSGTSVAASSGAIGCGDLAWDIRCCIK